MLFSVWHIRLTVNLAQREYPPGERLLYTSNRQRSLKEELLAGQSAAFMAWKYSILFQEVKTSFNVQNPISDNLSSKQVLVTKHDLIHEDQF